jgi:hypothetical protein
MKTVVSLLAATMLAAVLAIVVAPVRGATPKREVLPEAPPPAVPLSVKVTRGETIDIPLRIYGRKNELLKYLIRVPPQHGKLSDVRVVEREVSSVTYTPPKDLATTRDRFSYAVQNAAGVSAAVEVTIEIVDTPARLAITDVLDFPVILAGTTAVKPVEITNRGGSIAEGEVAVDAPWRIEGSANYHLGAGERAAFKVVFAPGDGGKFDGAVRYTSQPEQSTRIHGEAKAVISAEPAKVVLQRGPGEAVRVGAFELANATDESRKMRIAGGGRLQLPAEVVVPAQGKVSVPVHTAEGDVAAFEAEVRAEAPGLIVRVAVQAPRLGPVLRVSRGRVDFGRIDATKQAEVAIDLENIGGAPATIACEIDAPFSAEPPTGLVMSGEKKTFTIRVGPGSAGKVTATLRIKTEPQVIEVPVEADFFGRTMPVSAVAQSASRRESTRAVAHDDAHESTAESAVPSNEAGAAIPPEWLADLRSVPGLIIGRSGTTHAEFSWPANLNPATRFRIEGLSMYVDESGEPRMRWDEFPRVKVVRRGERWSATIEGLRTGGEYRVRAVPVGGSGEAGESLFQVQLATLKKPAFVPAITPLRGLLLALAAWLGFIAWQRIRERRAARRGA